MEKEISKSMFLSPNWYADLEKILSHMRCGLIVADGDGTVLYGNLYYSLLSGFDVRKYVGKDIRTVSQNEQVLLPQGKTLFDRVKRYKKEISESVVYNTDDLVTTTAIPMLDKRGRLKYVVYTVSNYSDATRLREDLERSTELLEALETELKTRNSARLSERNIVAKSEVMRNLFKNAARIASFPVPVLITGESGVGKDVLARHIHASSLRADKKFIAVNLGAIPASLFESELFGYEAGAFTGASGKGKLGLFQLANEGTLFLDEIGELPMELQTKLLQALQSNSVRRVGGTQDEIVDVRVIAATNRDLEAMVQSGAFRLDLYYRLNVIELSIPPLRSRKEDIPFLINQFLLEFNEKYRQQKYISAPVVDALRRYAWPGNVRELRHVVESMVITSEPGHALTVEDIPTTILEETREDDAPTLTGADRTLKEAIAMLEQKMILDALKKHHTTAAAASALGVSSAALLRKRKAYDL